MEAKSLVLMVACILLELLLLISPMTSAFMMTPQSYQSDQSSIIYKMPRRHSIKFKVFAECRRDCAGKCNHSLYAYLANKNECFTCLLECMTVFTEQAEKMGIRIDSVKSKRRARRVPEVSPPATNAEKISAGLRSPYALRGYSRTQQ